MRSRSSSNPASKGGEACAAGGLRPSSAALSCRWSRALAKPGSPCRASPSGAVTRVDCPRGQRWLLLLPPS
eukprot:7991937-Alexandrium_andersonii.AAC.1